MYGAVMDFRGRDLLSAEARFLADYCGEEAVRRWHARLSDSERDQLASTYAFVEEICRSLVGLIRRSFQMVLRPLVSLVRSFSRMCVALITGDAPGSFGHQTP
jgi:hypothetical protein